MAVTKCPKCGCPAYTKQGKELTKHKGEENPVLKERRKCKYCGCKYTVNPKDRQNPNCPYCASSKVSKEGKIEGGHKYKCNKCGKHFRNVYEKGKPPVISDYIKQKVKLYHSGGFSNKFIAKMFGIGATTVARIIDIN